MTTIDHAGRARSFRNTAGKRMNQFGDATIALCPLTALSHFDTLRIVFA
jgi:hypothetical protein